jgi:hypothetical protein
MVYFVATKLLREQRLGPTLLISPLLALMRNQISAAQSLGIRAQTINSSNRDEWKNIEGLLKQNLVGNLDDPFGRACEKCANCAGAPLLPVTIRPELAKEAALFLKRSHQPIQPRRQWPSGNAFPVYGFRGRIGADLQAAEGRALSIWGDDCEALVETAGGGGRS